MASHSPKASFREDNGSHDGLGFNNTIPIDQVEFTGTFGRDQSKSQVADVDFKAWGQPVTTNFLAPIERNIQQLSKDLLSQKDFVKELFLGVLTLHYSAEVCHGL